MIESARLGVPWMEFELADLRDWVSRGEEVDVLLSNATLQWLPDHLDLLPALAARVRPGGCLAFQVPGNFDEPSHTIRDELALNARHGLVDDWAAFRAHQHDQRRLSSRFSASERGDEHEQRDEKVTPHRELTHGARTSARAAAA